MSAARATWMIVGLNRAVEHEGRHFHVQVEDLGAPQRVLRGPAARGGGIVWRKQVDYREILGRGLPRDGQDDAVLATMEKTLHTVVAAIARGKLP